MMNRYMKLPDITLYGGINVDRNTKLKWKSKDKRIKQELKDLKFCSCEKIEGNNFETERKTIIQMEEGSIILFEDEKRGYVVPLESFVTIGEALEELEAIKDLDKEE